MSQPVDIPDGYHDVAIPMEALLVPGLILGSGIAVLALFPHLALHGVNSFLDMSPLGGGAFILALIGLLVAHELLHAAGWMLAGRLGWNQVSFGIDRQTLSPYAHMHAPMSARAYRIGAVLPGIGTGLLPLLIGWISGIGPITLLGTFMLVGAVGDLIILWVIRHVPAQRLVRDHPVKAGCWVKDDE